MSPVWPGNREEFCLMFIWEISSQLRRWKNVQRPTQILAVNQLACHLGFPAKLLQNSSWFELRTTPCWTRVKPRGVMRSWICFVSVTGMECSYGKDFQPGFSLRRKLCAEARSRKPSKLRWPCSYEEALKNTLKYSSRYYIYLKIITFRIFLMNFWDSYCSSKEPFTFAEHSKRGVPYDIFSFKTSFKGILVRNSNWCTYINSTSERTKAPKIFTKIKSLKLNDCNDSKRKKTFYRMCL